MEKVVKNWHPNTSGDVWCWSDTAGAVEVRFVGKRTHDREPSDGEDTLSFVVPPSVEVARLEQVHSATVVEAQPGLNGRGDALTTAARGLALCVATADCVPVLLAAGDEIAAVHAGWRGLAGHILPETVRRLKSQPPMAWIGPAIGPCCYEVGADVAGRVSSSCRDDVVRPGRGERPHLDLVATARSQLVELGITEVRSCDVCTRCHADRLWSYRRDGTGCGRNLAVVWRTLPPTS